MKDLFATLAKLVILLVLGALALYGLYSLYKKYLAPKRNKDFADTLDYDRDFGYDDGTIEEDLISQKIRSAKEKISNVIG